MYRWLSIGCLGLACTRANPAFGTLERDADGASGEAGSETHESDTDPLHRGTSSTSDAEVGTGHRDTGDSEGTSDTSIEPTCALKPTEGMTLAFADPAYFSGNCPSSVTAWAQVVAAEGDSADILICAEGCEQCSGPTHVLTVFPSVVPDPVPLGDEGCLRIEAEGPSVPDPDTDFCSWGALTLYDATSMVPYFIGTTRSHDPTAWAAERLAGLLPEPVRAVTCACDALGLMSDCCTEAGEALEFWSYEWDGMNVLPGETAPLNLPNQAGLQHTFELFQAQRTPSCEPDEREVSWAIVAEL